MITLLPSNCTLRKESPMKIEESATPNWDNITRPSSTSLRLSRSILRTGEPTPREDTPTTNSPSTARPTTITPSPCSSAEEASKATSTGARPSSTRENTRKARTTSTKPSHSKTETPCTNSTWPPQNCTRINPIPQANILRKEWLCLSNQARLTWPKTIT